MLEVAHVVCVRCVKLLSVAVIVSGIIGRTKRSGRWTISHGAQSLGTQFREGSVGGCSTLQADIGASDRTDERFITPPCGGGGDSRTVCSELLAPLELTRVVGGDLRPISGEGACVEGLRGMNQLQRVPDNVRRIHGLPSKPPSSTRTCVNYCRLDHVQLRM